MKLSQSLSKTKVWVIAGYILVVLVMIWGLITIYNNLVSFSEKKIRGEDMSQLIVVGNTISKLYELESEQNLLSATSARSYFEKYDSLKPIIRQNIDSLRTMSGNHPIRIAKIDSIDLYLSLKEANMREIVLLLDSIRNAPQIIRETFSSYRPKNLNSDIESYLKSKNVIVSDSAKNDTTVVRKERKKLFGRLRDAIVGKQDSSVIVETQTVVSQKDVKFAIDTVVNMVRYSERLNFDRQRQFQYKLFDRQAKMSNTNTMLTIQIEGLLKSIEQEELEKSIRLLQDKETTLNRSQKTLLTVSALAVLIALLFGFLFLGDINRSQRYRKGLEQSNRKINELLKAREKLMLSISHDIKAPMSSILGYIELSESTADKANRDAYLKNMKNSGEHVLNLVKKLLDYQKIETGNWMHKNVNYSVSEMFIDIVSGFIPLAEKKGLRYIINNKLPGNLQSHGDPLVIREILNNIISNAIKYTFGGSVEVGALKVGEDSNALIRFSIKDTGLGMDKSELEKIFEEFVQLETASAVEGAGLGLAIVKGLVQEMRGKISVVSEKGKGSEFVVELPLVATVTVQESSLGEPEPDAVTLDNLSVLVVDDDKIQLAMVAEMLKWKNIRVATETNPNKALEIIEQQPFDLIFIDMQMPEMSGLELLERIRRANIGHLRNTPIISLSANSELTKEDLNKLGFADFLNKPFTSKELYSVVRKHVSPEKTSEINALVRQIADDKAGALEILQSFVEGMSEDVVKLKEAFAADDREKASALAHKVYPVIAMINSGQVSELLLKINRKESVPVDDKDFVVQTILAYITQAKEKIEEFEISSR